MLTKFFIVNYPDQGGMIILDRVTMEAKMKEQPIDFFIPVFKDDKAACEFAKRMGMQNITLTELTLESKTEEVMN